MRIPLMVTCPGCGQTATLEAINCEDNPHRLFPFYLCGNANADGGCKGTTVGAPLIVEGGGEVIAVEWGTATATADSTQSAESEEG